MANRWRGVSLKKYQRGRQRTQRHLASSSLKPTRATGILILDSLIELQHGLFVKKKVRLQERIGTVPKEIKDPNPQH
jgi:hypothetical protein